jgi:hypothetical protein
MIPLEYSKISWYSMFTRITVKRRLIRLTSVLGAKKNESTNWSSWVTLYVLAYSERIVFDKNTIEGIEWRSRLGEIYAKTKSKERRGEKTSWEELRERKNCEETKEMGKLNWDETKRVRIRMSWNLMISNATRMQDIKKNNTRFTIF